MFQGFSKDAFKFFSELEDNNDRDWFQENKSRYEEIVLFPAMSLVEAMEKPLRKISSHFTAIAKRSGGSIMRIYRDTRFSKNKEPYKNNLGIQFRHEMGKDVHAPGFYFHLDAHEVFFGGGIWRPDSKAIRQIRELINDQPARWKRIVRAKKFRERFDLHGESLKRPPRGFSADHPLIEDLKRKDHLVMSRMAKKVATNEKLIDQLASEIKAMMPYVRFLCDALHLPS